MQIGSYTLAMDYRRTRPRPPTSSLPRLSRLSTCSFKDIKDALRNLHSIYVDPALRPVPKAIPSKCGPQHVIHDSSVPDSGYASEEDEDGDTSAEPVEEEAESFDIDILRSDALEREYAIRWLTGFTARSEIWVSSADSDADADTRAALVDTAASVLAAFAGEDEEEALVRRFSFHTSAEDIEVVLNDAPLLSEDHTSVGLQSWGSSILLSERICASPSSFGLSLEVDKPYPRVLELGAGTGLLSIVAAKILQRVSGYHHSSSVVATDYHPSVLANLSSNVATNFSDASEHPLIVVRPLDWEHPVYENEFASSFDVILAADVVYHPQHAAWIKSCVERLLTRPNDGVGGGGVFWLIIPLRPTGRHEGMCNTVEMLFPRGISQGNCGSSTQDDLQLAILKTTPLERHQGIGRIDEGGYKLYQYGWVRRQQ